VLDSLAVYFLKSADAVDYPLGAFGVNTQMAHECQRTRKECVLVSVRFDTLCRFLVIVEALH